MPTETYIDAIPVDGSATNYTVNGLSPASTTYYFVVQFITQPALPQQKKYCA
ncbi:MAG: hypothetical protein R3E08_12190 [Thiotrichaceae bacterium]